MSQEYITFTIGQKKNIDYKHEVINFKQHIADRAETL